jgi:phosphoadenosine phosphosulfate reductase
MSLIEYTLDGKVDKVQKAIDRIKDFEPISHGFDDKPYYVCYSGGKDSDCIRILCDLAGVPYDLICHWTGVDAPETWKYIHTIPNLQIETPKKSMFQLIVDNGMPPTRTVRYCCKELKERGGEERFVMTGVRWAESVKRAKNRGVIEKSAERPSDRIVLNNDNAEERKVMDVCMSQHKRVLNPIVDWTDEDVWEFLHSQGCEGNPLYQCGYKRIGCIGCPQAYYKAREADFERYPGYKKMYLNAFAKMLERLKERGREVGWKTPEDVFHWWLYENKERRTRDLDGQLTLDD